MIQIQNPQAHVSDQLTSLNGVIDILSDALYSESRSSLEPHEKRTMEVNDAAREALEMSVVKACDRLDKILSDDHNWKPLAKSGLAKKIDQIVELHRQTLAAQKNAADEAVSAHRIFPPILGRGIGEYIAQYNGLQFRITGRGPSLVEAIYDYDNQFSARITPEMMKSEREAFQRQQAQALEEIKNAVTAPVKPRKKKK